MYVFIYLSLYIYIYTHRERERCIHRGTTIRIDVTRAPLLSHFMTVTFARIPLFGSLAHAGRRASFCHFASSKCCSN